MSSFYGNIKNSNRISLIFDKVYTSRKEMDTQCTGDGIFNNRFILIDYGQKTTIPYTRVFPTEGEFEAGVEIKKYWKLELASPSSIYKDLGYNPNTVEDYKSGEYNADNVYYIKRESMIDSKTLEIEPKPYSNNNKPVLCPFVANKELDLYEYGDEYHHTVWQKIWTQTGNESTVVEKYICVAKLDAEAPILNLIVDAPSDEDATGFNYVLTDKNIDGFLSHKQYESFKDETSGSWVYVTTVKNGNIIYTAASEYDIGTIYYTFEKVPFKTPSQNYEIYVKQIDEDTKQTDFIKYQIPILYKMWQLTYEQAKEQLESGNIYVLATTTSGQDQYYQRLTSINISETQTYFRKEVIKYETESLNGHWYADDENTDILRKFYPPEVFMVHKAQTGYDVENGYITKELYENYPKELFYYDNNQNAISTLIPIKPPEDGIEPNGIYYKNKLRLIEKKNTAKYPIEFEYFKKKDYNANYRYWEQINMGQGPHFDPLKSTDLEYMFHVPRPWKFAKDVEFDYNAKGFIPYEKSFDDSGINRIKLEIEDRAEKLTTQYPVHMPELPEAAEYEKSSEGYNKFRSTIKMALQPDTKYFDVRLPEIGNAMSDIWDLIYPRGAMEEYTGEMPSVEYKDFQNQLLGEDGQALFYYKDSYKDGYLSKEKYEELKDHLAIKVDGVFIDNPPYDHNQIYYEVVSNENEGTSYAQVQSDIQIYYPIYDIKEIQEKVAEGVQFFTFKKGEGTTRILFIGNDREINSNADYPSTIGDVIRHAYYLLGLKEDNDTIDNPPRGTIYGLLNGAKMLYGDPADQISGSTYEPIEISGEEEFNQLKESLWIYDSTNKAWVPAADIAYNPQTSYFIASAPGYQLVPTDLKDAISDGYISEELFAYMQKVGKTLYVPDGKGGFREYNEEYDSNIQYYSNLTTLWAYLNDISSKYPLYQADWTNNNSASIGYIKNRPIMVASNKVTENENYPEDGVTKHIENLWDNTHSVPVLFINLNDKFRIANNSLKEEYNAETNAVKTRYAGEVNVLLNDVFPADIADEQGIYQEDINQLMATLQMDVTNINTQNQNSMLYDEENWTPIIDNAYNKYSSDSQIAMNATGYQEDVGRIAISFQLEDGTSQTPESQLNELKVEDYETISAFNEQVEIIRENWLKKLNNQEEEQLGIIDTWTQAENVAASQFSTTVNSWKSLILSQRDSWIAELDNLKTTYSNMYINLFDEHYPEIGAEIATGLLVKYNALIEEIDNIYEQASNDNENEDLGDIDIDLLDLYNIFTEKLKALKDEYANSFIELERKYPTYEWKNSIEDNSIQETEWIEIKEVSLAAEPTNTKNSLHKIYNDARTAELNKISFNEEEMVNAVINEIDYSVVSTRYTDIINQVNENTAVTLQSISTATDERLLLIAQVNTNTQNYINETCDNLLLTEEDPPITE